jgi:transcriptional regulator GlxA family with amidase domain
MHRRRFIGSTLAASVALFAGGRAAAAGAGAAGLLPKRERTKVAFMLGDGANVIDTAGPWEVFQDTVTTIDGQHRDAFELYTVAPTEAMLRMTGGLTVKPAYSILNAPQPDLIVVPAHKSTDESIAWLREASAGADVTLSICTGAYQLAKAGLLKGVPATTHHDFWDEFQAKYPDVELKRGLRFVDSGRTATAGGLTSGIDLALHIVARYHGVETAAATAAYMEYTSDAWRG